jgi:Protein of unknown function (DUF2516)
MFSGVPFYLVIRYWIELLLLAGVLAVELVAFISCARQRTDAFPVVGPISKVGWLGILGGSMLLTYLCYNVGFFLMIASISLAAALIYLLDVRPALRDAVEGSGPW